MLLLLLVVALLLLEDEAEDGPGVGALHPLKEALDVLLLFVAISTLLTTTALEEASFFLPENLAETPGELLRSFSASSSLSEKS